MTSNQIRHSLQFRESYTHSFAIPDYLTTDLSIYKRLNWSAAYFMDQWSSNIGTYAAGTIRRYNHIFHVQFCSGCSIGAIIQKLESNPNLQLALSFRKADNLPAYVIVDFIKGEH